MTPKWPPVYFLAVDDVEENLIALDALLKRDGLVILRAVGTRSAGTLAQARRRSRAR